MPESEERVKFLLNKKIEHAAFMRSELVKKLQTDAKFYEMLGINGLICPVIKEEREAEIAKDVLNEISRLEKLHEIHVKEHVSKPVVEAIEIEIEELTRGVMDEVMNYWSLENGRLGDACMLERNVATVEMIDVLKDMLETLETE